MLPPFGVLQFFPNIMSAILLDSLHAFNLFDRPYDILVRYIETGKKKQQKNTKYTFMWTSYFFFSRGQFCRKCKTHTHTHTPVFIPNIRKIGY